MVVIVWDHPRVCGEKSYQDSQHGCQSGSPPRMRGKDANGLNMLSNLGITPAYAGKRPSRLRRDHERRDHPRVCGEKCKSTRQNRAKQGSPPRMRGKESSRDILQQAVGITPAYAGKSVILASCAACSWDHPRVCGEKLRGRIPRLPSEGSPPRMRGKGSIAFLCLFCLRITPAYAGKSPL